MKLNFDLFNEMETFFELLINYLEKVPMSIIIDPYYYAFRIQTDPSPLILEILVIFCKNVDSNFYYPGSN